MLQKQCTISTRVINVTLIELVIEKKNKIKNHFHFPNISIPVEGKHNKRGKIWEAEMQVTKKHVAVARNCTTCHILPHFSGSHNLHFYLPLVSIQVSYSSPFLSQILFSYNGWGRKTPVKHKPPRTFPIFSIQV